MSNPLIPNDRVATHDSSRCAAYGCPMLGTTSTSTSGGSDWLCWLHFGKDASQWQSITAELNRVRWLVEATQAVRRYSSWPDKWPEVYRKVKQEIVRNQRSDLLNAKGESSSAWAQRLDAELRDMCAGKAPMPLLQAVDPGASDSWKKTEFKVPEPA